MNARAARRRLSSRSSGARSRAFGAGAAGQSRQISSVSPKFQARTYLAHPLLGPRYRECVVAVRAQVDAGSSLEAIFGELDAMKFRS